MVSSPRRSRITLYSAADIGGLGLLTSSRLPKTGALQGRRAQAPLPTRELAALTHGKRSDRFDWRRTLDVSSLTRRSRTNVEMGVVDRGRSHGQTQAAPVALSVMEGAEAVGERDGGVVDAGHPTRPMTADPRATGANGTR